jgi:hypothetical protein
VPGMQCLEDVVPGRRPLRGSISRRYDSDGKCSDQQPIPLLNPVRADLAELLDWVEGVSTAAQQARDKGNITLDEALENTRFKVYQGYLAELHHQQSQAVDDQEAKH